ncbi:MAG TPA: hypothetical protein EYP86_04655 [Candidatus Altiarchaeales archaeon]|nr:hypothetical protein [Candidatus Altiarchaeales archaeon]
MKLRNKGYGVLVDSIMSMLFLLIIITVIFSIQYSKVSRTDVTEFRDLHYLSEDALDVLNKKGILDEITRSWAENDTKNASNLTKEYLEKILPRGVGYRLEIVDENGNEISIYDSSSNPNRTSESVADTKTHSERILVGYGRGKPTLGRVAKISLSSIESKLTSSYVYFGGFVGQGNITRILKLPSDAIIESAYMELNPGNDFYLYVNGVQCGTLYSGSGWNLTADSWNLPTTCFSPGENVININFTDSEDNFIGGGYIRVNFKTSHVNWTPEFDTYYFPGIKGLINLYSSIYVHGLLQDMDIYLHYKNNISINETERSTVYYTVLDNF